MQPVPEANVVAGGRVVADRYAIVRPLQHGGFGTLYLAQHVRTASPCALKVMHPQFLHDERICRLFELEARVVARIPSDHVVRVFDAGVEPDTLTPWMAMELLEGEDLLAAVKRRGLLPITEVREIVLQVCDALAAAHRIGVVHRDLKPPNVFLSTARGERASLLVKLIDFGIAKILADADAGNSLVIGTPEWMAPEQTGRDLPISTATDVWALGLLVFWLLTGRLYWSCLYTDPPGPVFVEAARSPRVPASRRANEYGVGDRIPAGFDAWFARCLAADPAARFSDAAVARDALLPLLDTSERMPAEAASQPTARITRPPNPLGGRRRLIRILAAVAAAGAVALGVKFLDLPGAGDAARSRLPAGQTIPKGDDTTMPTRTSRPSGPCGDATADDCSLLGERQNRAEMGPRADEAAVGLFAHACRLGSALGCLRLGELTRGSWGTPRDGAAAARAFEEACRLGEARGCFRRAEDLEQGGDAAAAEALYRRACDAFERACDVGRSDSCGLLGVCHYLGRGRSHEPTMARSFFDGACTSGEPTACRNLAFLWEAGVGGRRDHRRALELNERACEGLDAVGCRNAGILLEGGVGQGASSSARAVSRYLRACDLRDATGCGHAGAMLLGGRGIPRDVRRGRALLAVSCEHGDEEACRRLGGPRGLP